MLLYTELNYSKMVDMKAQFYIYIIIYGGLILTSLISIISTIIFQNIQIIFFTHSLGVFLICLITLPSWPMWYSLKYEFAKFSPNAMILPQIEQEQLRISAGEKEKRKLARK